MRITFILPMFLDSPSGGFKVVYEYANRLCARGHSVTVIHPRNINTQSGSIEKIKAILWKYKLKFSHNRSIPWFETEKGVRLEFVPDLGEASIPEGDAVIATAYQTAFPVAGYSPGIGNKFYLIQSYETWHGSEERVRESWMLPLHKIVISKWLYNISLELGQGENTTFIPNGLDLNKFRLTRSIRDRSGARVVMLAHPDSVKGTADGLAAIEIAKRRVPEMTAALFGTVERNGSIPDWIEYFHRPSPEQLTEIYNSGTVFLHPSRMEGWGLPAAESMACGCALVSTSNGGVMEFATDGEDAMLSPVGNYEELAENLVAVLKDNSLRTRLAEAGNRRIQNFGWDKSVDAIEELLIAKATEG